MVGSQLENIMVGPQREKPGAIARSVAMSLGNQEAPRSILASRTSFHEDLVMKLFLRPFSSYADSRSVVVS